LQTGQLIKPSALSQVAAIFDGLDVSEATRADHKWRIGAFLRFLEGEPLGPNCYLNFKRYLARRNDLSVSTKNKYLVSARVLLRELTRRGDIDRDLTSNVRLFEQSKKHKREGVTEEEMARLAAYLRGLPPSPTNLRLKAIIALLALQGLRQIEAQRLNVSDLDFVAHTALVQGKGRDDKEPVDLHPQTVQVLRAYLKAGRIADGPLFPSRHHSAIYERLTVRAIYQLVADAFAEVGIDKSPHGLRHLFTTTLLKGPYKGDLNEVRRYTRHTSTEMLAIYDDRINQKADLPRFFRAFEGVKL
jgi:integrase